MGLKSHFLSNKDIFLKSFSGLDRGSIYSMLADMLQMILVLFLVVPLFLVVVKSSAMPLLTEVMPTIQYVNSYTENQGQLPPMTDELQARLDDNVRLIKSFLFRSAGVLLLAVALIILLSSVFRGFVYGRLNKKHFRVFFKPFFVSNIIWFSFWFLLIAAVLLLFKIVAAGYIIALLLIAAIILTPIYRALHDGKAGIKEHSQAFIRDGVMRIYMFILPILAIYFVFLFIFYSLGFILNDASFRLTAFIIFIMAFAFVTWARGYIFIYTRHHMKNHLKKHAMR